MRCRGGTGPILTDSGGFQIFSLKAINQITEQEATFRSHIDGAIIRLTPEHSIEIQEALGSDVAMVLDHVIALPASRDDDRRRHGTFDPLGQAMPGSGHARRSSQVCDRPRRTR